MRIAICFLIGCSTGAELDELQAVVPGDHCSAGGQVQVHGVDRDDNGTLGAGEITSSVYECRVVLPGDFEVRAQKDVDYLRDIRELQGALVLRGTTPDTLALPNLEQVKRIEAKEPLDNLAHIDLPKLRGLNLSLISAPRLVDIHVPDVENGAIAVAQTPLATLALPSFVQGDVTLAGAHSIATLELPSLRDGDVTITTSQLDSLDAPRWETGHLVITTAQADVLRLPAFKSGDVSLTEVWTKTLDLPLLHDGVLSLQATDVEEIAAPKCVSCSVSVTQSPSFRLLTAPVLQIGRIVISGPSRVSGIDLPMLTSTAEISLTNNPQLAAISAPQLALATTLRFINNVRLPACQAARLITQAHPSTSANSGNDETAGCN